MLKNIKKYYTIPIIYLPFANMLDFKFSGNLPVFTLFLLFISLLYLYFKVHNKNLRIDLVSIGTVIFVFNVILTSIITDYHPTFHRLINVVCIILLVFNFIEYGKLLQKKEHLVAFLSIVYIFVAIFTFIYTGLFIYSSFDLISLRAGMYIFGSNTFLAFLLGFAILEKMNEHYKMYYIFIIIYGLLTLLFVSRGNLIIFTLILLYELLLNPKIKSIRKFMLLITIIIFFTFALNWLSKTNPDVIARLTTSFDLFQIENLSNDARASIFDEAIHFLKQNLRVLFFGLGIDNFRFVNFRGYSDPHNFILDLIFVGGIPLLLFILFLFVNIIKKSKEKILVLLYLILLTFEGIASTHFRGSVKSSYILLIIIWMYYTAINQSNKNNAQNKRVGN